MPERSGLSLPGGALLRSVTNQLTTRLSIWGNRLARAGTFRTSCGCPPGYHAHGVHGPRYVQDAGSQED